MVIIRLFCLTRLTAALLGVYLYFSATAMTFCLVACEIRLLLPDNARDTVATETPHSRAISLIVTFILPTASVMYFHFIVNDADSLCKREG